MHELVKTAVTILITLIGSAGQRIPLSQVGKVEVFMEEPLMRRRDRVPTITVRGSTL